MTVCRFITVRVYELAPVRVEMGLATDLDTAVSASQPPALVMVM